MNIKQILLIVLALTVVYYIYTHIEDTKSVIHSFNNASGGGLDIEKLDPNSSNTIESDTKEPISSNEYKSDSGFPTERLTAQDLLPNEESNLWSDQNPDPEGMQHDMIHSGSPVGILTATADKRNANKQLRSDPLIPRIPTGPWNQSTIQPDMYRKQFDIE